MCDIRPTDRRDDPYAHTPEAPCCCQIVRDPDGTEWVAIDDCPRHGV